MSEAREGVSRDGALSIIEVKRFYARVANFPNKIDNLRAKIAALRDEAEALGFREEGRLLGAMAVFADALPKAGPKLVNWSADEVLTLKRLWLEGLTCAQIGKQIGRTAAAVQRSARKHNLPKRRAMPNHHERKSQ
jgi:hypothetical protein